MVTPPKVRVLSDSSQPFTDRREAGRMLSDALDEYRGQKLVVLGIPRGGIIVAREISRALDGQLDIVLAHKLRTPGQEELAMGSVSEDGKIFLNQEVVRYLDVGSEYIEQEKLRQMAEMKRRTGLIRKVRPRVPLKGRVVIVTDDGVATGSTTQAAFWAVRTEQPARLIAAIPVGPRDTILKLAADVDEMVCLRTPPYFSAVGQFYYRFSQVEDDEMLQILREESGRNLVK